MSSNHIRWSGTSLMLGGILLVMVSILPPSDSTFVLYMLAGIAASVLLLLGLIGLHMLQAAQSGRLGQITILLLSLAYIASILASIFFLLTRVLNEAAFFSIFSNFLVPDLFLLGLEGAKILGFILLGICINRAKVFPPPQRHGVDHRQPAELGAWHQSALGLGADRPGLFDAGGQGVEFLTQRNDRVADWHNALLRSMCARV